jgi:hypothetical protein
MRRGGAAAQPHAQQWQCTHSRGSFGAIIFFGPVNFLTTLTFGCESERERWREKLRALRVKNARLPHTPF